MSTQSTVKGKQAISPSQNVFHYKVTTTSFHIDDQFSHKLNIYYMNKEIIPPYLVF
jgi:hypothetical protein